MRKVLLPVILYAVLGFGITACDDNEDYEKLRERELELLADYVSRYNEEHNVELEPTASGLYYIEIEEGEGDTIKVGDKVQLWYNTYLLRDTSLIDSNMESGHKYNPMEFTVVLPDNSTVIEGLNEAVKYMKPGGKSFLIVPSQIAYGQNGSYGIPAFATLLFDVEIYKVFRAEDEW
jgi:FKBP-type peptidyl-prolyl cis-trans isomerase